MERRCEASFVVPKKGPMKENTIVEDVKKLIYIMIPILIAQAAQIGLNFLNAAMSGHASPEDLAGVSVGSSLVMPVTTAASGILAAATPIIAQLIGQKKREEIPAVVRTGLLIGIALEVLLVAGYFCTVDSVIGGLGLEPEVDRIARYYLLAVILGLFFVLLIQPLRSLTDTVGGTSISMKLYLCAFPINAVLNYALIFGNLGAPRLGGIGAGIATAVTYAVLFLMFLAVVQGNKIFGMREIFSSFRFSRENVREYLAVGLPNGMGIFMETSLFGFIIIFITKFGTQYIAAHEAAMNFSNLVYMFPLSFSMALTILVGMEAGAQRYDRARRFSRIGIVMALGCAAAVGTVSVLGRHLIAQIYAEDPILISYIMQFLIYMAMWQVFDAIACPIQGILRGYKDVKAAFYTSTAAYWIICAPLGWVLDHVMGHGPFSYWQGLVVAVGASAFFLAIRLRWLERHIAGSRIRVH